MKNLLVLTALACSLTSPAYASSRSPLFEIRHVSELKESTSITRIYADGELTVQKFRPDGTRESVLRARLDRHERKELREALNDASWTVTHPQIRCFAYSYRYTQYFVHGELMYTARTCGGEQADSGTLASIATIEHLVASR